MPKFSANLSTMFREHSLIDRPRAAAEAGFRAIEIQFPYELEYKALAAEISRYALAVSVINVPCGDFIDGGEGNSALPNRIDDFRESVLLAAKYARGLGALNVNILAGTPSIDDETAKKKPSRTIFVMPRRSSPKSALPSSWRPLTISTGPVSF